MIGQIKGKVERKVGREEKEKMEEGEDAEEEEEREKIEGGLRKKRRKKKKSGAEAHGLEKPQVLRGLIDGEDGCVAVDLPSLSIQLVFILTVLCYH